ncbi:4'-phosphopantetheinyl transferase family protein, partial [Petrachloros mirabilis]
MEPELLVPTLTFPPVERIVTSLSIVPISIVKGAIHLWPFSLEGGAGCVERCRAVLSHDEQGRVERFVRQEHRISYILSHGGLRAVLARYVGVDPSALTFQSGSNGKPLLLDSRGRPDALKFNIAHSHGRMVIAV